MTKLDAESTLIIDEGVNSEDFLESQIKEIVDEDLANVLKNRKHYSILEDERPSKASLSLENIKRGYDEAISLNKENL